MFLHLGEDIVVSEKDIIGIFDIENTSVSRHTRTFLTAAEQNGRIFNVSYEMPKSYIVCRNQAGKETIYISQISSATLRKRAEKLQQIQ